MVWPGHPIQDLYGSGFLGFYIFDRSLTTYDIKKRCEPTFYLIYIDVGFFIWIKVPYHPPPPEPEVITCEKLEEGKRYAYYFGKLLGEKIIDGSPDYTYRKHNLTFEFGSLNGVYKDRDENLVKNSDKYSYVLGKLDDIKDNNDYKILKFSIGRQIDPYRRIQWDIQGILSNYIHVPDKADVWAPINGKNNLNISIVNRSVAVTVSINTYDGKFILLQESEGGRRSLRNTLRRRRGMSHLRRRKTAARRRSSKRSKMT